MTETPLKKFRRELGYTQEDFAIFSGIRLKTYRNAERGLNTSYTTAKAILDSLNTSRRVRHLSEVTLDELGLTVV